MWKRIWHFIVAIICLSILFLSDFQDRVVGNSMLPELQDGDWLFVKKPIFKIEKGDIVIVNTKNIKKGKIIKRVIGVPGEEVIIKNGQLSVSGIRYADTEKEDSVIQLKKNEFFILGDNIDVSIDSRHFGTVNRSQILGKVVFRFYPKPKKIE